MDAKALRGEVDEYASVTSKQLGNGAEDAKDANVGDCSLGEASIDSGVDSLKIMEPSEKGGWSLEEVERWLKLRIENNSLAGVPRVALFSAIPSELLQKVALKLDVHKVQRAAWRKFMEDIDGASF